MSKISVSKYAQALYIATKDKSQKEIDGLISNLIKILDRNRQIKLFAKISQKFEEIWNKENEAVEAEVVSFEKLDEKFLKKIESFIKEKYFAKKVVIVNKIDEKIKGGIIIKVGDEVLDGSVRGQMSKLRENLEK
jgi:F-type H+-transporting ATPase subunit delta